MKAECPMGHRENLSHEELFRRFISNDFECNEGQCEKECSYEIDHVFWKEYMAPLMPEEFKENIEQDVLRMSKGESLMMMIRDQKENTDN